MKLRMIAITGLPHKGQVSFKGMALSHDVRAMEPTNVKTNEADQYI